MHAETLLLLPLLPQLYNTFIPLLLSASIREPVMDPAAGMHDEVTMTAHERRRYFRKRSIHHTGGQVESYWAV